VGEYEADASSRWELDRDSSYSFDIYTTGATTNSSLIFDTAGNLCGTNQFGGVGTTMCLWFGGGNESASCGTAFKLTPAGDGTWTSTTLHSFGTGTDGQVPFAGVILDAAGNLYGTTSSGGAPWGRDGVRDQAVVLRPDLELWVRCDRRFLTSAKRGCYHRSCYNEDGGGNSSTGRAPDCGSDGCGFDSRFPPQIYLLSCRGALVPTLPQSLRDAIDSSLKETRPRSGRKIAGGTRPAQ
jgi:hypothetical protein